MIRLFSIVSICFLLLTACGQSEDFDTMVRGYASEKVELVFPTDITDSTLVLDAREREEYEVSHIPGARFVGYDDFEIEALVDVDKSRPIIVYCSVGYRSGKVAELLQEAGYTEVSNLYGGIFYWVNTDHPVVDEKGSTTRVHTYNKQWGTWLTKGEKVW